MQRTINFLINLGENIPRKQISLSFLIDLSGSMQGEPLQQVKNALPALLAPMVGNGEGAGGSAVDELTLITFETAIIKVCPWLKKEDYDYLRDCILAIPEVLFDKSGATHLYDAIEFAINDFGKADQSHEKVLVCFTDGDDFGSEHKLDEINKIVQNNQNIRVYCLYYRAEGASKRGWDIMGNFAKFTEGKVFESPTVEDIPEVLGQIIEHIHRGSDSGIREKLLKGLEQVSTGGTLNGKDWYRVFGLNNNPVTAVDPLQDAKHTIYRLEENIKGKRSAGRESFSKFLDGHKQDIQKNLLSQNTALNGQQINSDALIFVAFRGNDPVGLVSTEVILDMLKQVNRGNVIYNPDFTRVYVIILIDRFEDYNDEQKKNLFAQLYELKRISAKGEILGTVILCDGNFSSINNPVGYQQLKTRQFEEMVSECLLQMNHVQKLENQILNHQVSKNQRRHFLSTGGVSVHQDPGKIVEHSAHRFIIDLLSNLFDAKKMHFDDEKLKEKVNLFCETISPSPVSQGILYRNGRNLVDKLDASSTPLLADYRREITLDYKYYDDNGGLKSKSYTVKYEDEADYVRLALFDLRNYVESCNTLDQFEALAAGKTNELIFDYESRIENMVDETLYGNDADCSPLKAGEWIRMSVNRLKELIKEVEESGIIGKIWPGGDTEFSFKAESGKVIRNSDPNDHFSDLKEKFANHPLASALRLKYYLIALMLLSGLVPGIITTGYMFLLPVFLLPALAAVVTAELKLFYFRKSVKEMIAVYSASHAFRSREEAYKITARYIRSFYQQLLRKLDREATDPENSEKEMVSAVIEEYSEKELLEHFKDACTSQLGTIIRQKDRETESDCAFSKSLYGILERWSPDTLHDIIRTGYFGSELDWRVEYQTFKTSQTPIRKTRIPTVLTGLVPENIGTLENSTAIKIKVRKKTGTGFSYISVFGDLTNEDIDNLKKLSDSKQWSDTVTKLYAECAKVQTDNKAPENRKPMSLWRGVVNYQIWLDKLKDLIHKQNRNDKSPEELFDTWKKVYEARRQFQEALMTMSRKKWTGSVEAKFSLLDSLSRFTENNNFSQISNWIMGYSYPAIRKDDQTAKNVTRHLICAASLTKEGSKSEKLSRIISDTQKDDNLIKWDDMLSENRFNWNSYNYFTIKEVSLIRHISDESVKILDNKEEIEKYFLSSHSAELQKVASEKPQLSLEWNNYVEGKEDER